MHHSSLETSSLVAMPSTTAATTHSSPLRGLSGTISLSGSILPRTYDESGNLQYDTTVRIGHSSTRIIYTRDSDSRTRPIKESDLFPRPSQAEVEATTESTRKALEAIVNRQIKSSLPKQQGIESTISNSSTMTLISYTPSATNLALMNPDAPSNRTIKMVTAQVDPLDPAKFKHRKIPRGPPSPPVPVLHSPIRKATPEEYRAWIVPPSISNWKNPKGYTIPLDKRLACDGRSLQESVINDKFASFAESLYVAEAHAREEVARRNALERTLIANERLEKEAKLRQIAKETRAAAVGNNYRHQEVFSTHLDMTERDSLKKDVSNRDALRKEIASRRTAEYHHRSGSIQEREISEKIALNIPISSNVGSSAFDTRLFNQSEGVSSGFAPSDDIYSVYEKPLFAGSVSSLIYKPTLPNNISSTEEETYIQDSDAQVPTRSRQPPKQNLLSARAGLGALDSSNTTTARSGPVIFERGETVAPSDPIQKNEDDPFGLDSFLQAAKRGRHAK